MKNNNRLPSFLTPAEVARQLLVAPVTVRQWAQKGWLKAELTGGGHRRFLLHEVERFARERGLTLHNNPGGKLRILIVDDNQQFVNYLVELLQQQGGVEAVESAHDGFEAGLKVPNFKPDVILLDLMMQGMDGFTVCRLIKQQPATRAIRIVAMSGYFTDEKRHQILHDGAESCLTKPFESSALFQQLGISGDKPASVLLTDKKNSEHESSHHAEKQAG